MENQDSYEFQSDIDEEGSLVIKDDADEILMSFPLAQSTPQNETAVYSKFWQQSMHAEIMKIVLKPFILH